MQNSLAIGIDFGTTNSCAAVVVDGIPKTIKNSRGFLTTPSCVAYTTTNVLVGYEAKARSASNANNTVFGIKKLMGQTFESPSVQAAIKRGPVRIVNKEGKPKFEVEYRGEKQTLHVEQIAARIILEMRKVAEEYLKKPISNAVITIPASYKDTQRQAIIDAAKIAEVRVLRLINEPTAAAIAYGLEKTIENGKKILVFDLGGGTFDVTILAAQGGNISVKHTAGDGQLGGEYFTDVIVDYFVNKIRKEFNREITSDNRAMARLFRVCEEAKCNMSSSEIVEINIDNLLPNFDYNTEISRSKFNELCSKYFEKALSIVSEALFDSNLEKKDISEVVLVGGSTKIVAIRSMLREFFQDVRINISINPDEAVAHGAAIQAAILSDPRRCGLKDTKTIHDVTPVSLGIDTFSGLMSRIIDRNTPIPTVKMKTYSTAYDNQTFFEINVYEGERVRFEDNQRLATLRIDNVPPAPAGEMKMKVTFEINANGILTVSASLLSSRAYSYAVIDYNSGRLPTDEVQRLINEAKMHEEEDKLEYERICKKLELRDHVYQQRDMYKNLPNVVSTSTELLEWISTTPSASVVEYEKRRSEFDKMIEYIKFLSGT